MVLLVLLGLSISSINPNFFLFIIGFEAGYNFSWLLNKWGFLCLRGLIGFRVNSLLSEPTYLATALAPAIYVSTKNFNIKIKLYF